MKALTGGEERAKFRKLLDDIVPVAQNIRTLNNLRVINDTEACQLRDCLHLDLLNAYQRLPETEGKA
jgi:hypothetical protein